MTEAEWLASGFSTPMFDLLRERAAGSQRKRFLLSLTCCERVLDWMSEDGRQAVEVVRRYFEGRADPVSVDPRWLAWNGGAVQRLAREIAQARAFQRLPDLAEVLEQAGCSDPDLLGHCRQAGEHVEGCWTLDLLLSEQ